MRYLPAIGAVAVMGGLLAFLFLNGGALNWPTGVALLVIVAFTLMSAATLRYAVGTIAPEAPPPVDGDALLRSRLAPLVIGIGTSGILVLAVAVLISMVADGTPPEDSVLLGIFSTVIPVFSTWVGAVIAFYFSNESFRQAAAASGALKGDASESEPITSPTRMIPADKITGIVLGAVRKQAPSAQQPAAPQDAAQPASNDERYPDKHEDVPLADILWQFSNTVSRVIIFDAQMRPRAIIREKLVPADLRAQATGPAGARVEQYLKHEQNGSDAVNFKVVPETATVGDGRAMVKLFKLADLFVTRTGQADEPIKGWVPDDKLL